MNQGELTTRGPRSKDILMIVNHMKKNSSQTFAECSDQLRITFRFGTNSIAGDQDSDVRLAGFQWTDENRSIVGRRVGSLVDRLTIFKKHKPSIYRPTDERLCLPFSSSLY